MSIFLYSFLFLLFVNSYSCQSNSSISSVGKCDSVVSHLALELQSYYDEYEDGFQQFYQNLTNLCKSVSECYGSLQGEAAQNLKNIYDLRCEKYELYSHKMMNCLEDIAWDKYWTTNSFCKGKFDFTTNDLVARRKAFYDGKSCLTELADGRCYETAASYLKTNYDQFVNILTTAPIHGNCDSLFDEINKKQCSLTRNMMIGNWGTFKKYKLYGKDFESVINGNDQCKVLKQCHSDVCNSFPNSLQMEKCEVFDALSSDFFKCFDEKNGDISSLSFVECRNSTDKKECNRNEMIEKCGEESVKDFEKYYAFFKANDMDSVKKFKFLGNYTEYDAVEVKKNIESNDSKIGKCSVYVEDLVSLSSTTSNKKSIEILREKLEICQNITTCFESINSEESLKLKTFYQFACDDFEFSIHEMFYCLRRFYDDERWINEHSVENNDFFSKNLTVKRGAFVNEKSYFMAHVNKRCPKGKQYLEDNYNEFVDFITIQPENDDCKSIFSQTENYPCIPIIDYYVDDIQLERELNASLAYKIVGECRIANKCLEGSKCLSKQAESILKWCELGKHEGVPFYSCLEVLRTQNLDYSSHYCAPDTVTMKATGEEYLEQFISNKACLKDMMLETCGTDAIRGYDKYFKKVIDFTLYGGDYDDYDE